MTTQAPVKPHVTTSARPVSSKNLKRRFAYVGTGARAKMFLDPVISQYAEEAEIVGLCDLSVERASYQRDRIMARGYASVPVYGAKDFQKMLAETKPDTVVVCTMDCEHDQYIIPSLRAGCDVVSEKPMTVNAEKCNGILNAIEETGHNVRVTFNYRWAPGATKVREVLASGVIGKIHQVNMEYLLNTSHGADYFRRWHAEKKNSGGLLVHKSTHHFDLVNWWIDSIPESVFAKGGLYFYGRENAIRRGDEAYTRYPRYHGANTKGDPFAYRYGDWVVDDVDYEAHIYLDAEKESGYIRDQNVFRDGITIEDVMNVMVRYRDGVLLNYTLNAFSPYEGYRVSFTGDRGRVEYEENHGPHLIDANGEKVKNNEHAHSGGHSLKVFPHFKPAYEVEIKKASGGHGGGDPLLQEQIFKKTPPKDQFGRSAGHEQGAASILIGVAANRSMETGRDVLIRDMIKLKPEAQRLSDLI